LILEAEGGILKMISLEQLEELFKSRRSVRKWQDKEVPQEMLLKAVELAEWAPNGGNHQAYHFYIVTNKEKIRQIGEAVAQKTKLMASWPEAQEKYGDKLKKWVENAAFFASAPALIACAAGNYTSMADEIMALRPDDEEAKKMIAARALASSRVQSLAATIAHLLLAFEVLGLGAVWMTGPVQAKSEIEEIIGIKNYDLIAVIPVGFPAEKPSSPGRKPVEEIATIIS